MRLDYITKVKSTTWNADVIIEHNTYKVAFNVYKCLHNVEATYKAMRKERVYRCWLPVSYTHLTLPTNSRV